MTLPPPATRTAILAVDIGATSIKFGMVDDDGRLLARVQREPTPYPCSPQRLVQFVSDRIADSGCARVGLGFPGDLRDGRVVEPGNLSRPEGFTSAVDPVLLSAWRDLDLEHALRESSRCDVRVVNDATLAALGCSEGCGRELVFTLGTGFGIALVVEGAVVGIRDVGAEIFLDGATYDRLLGEHARSLDESLWRRRLVVAVARFAEEFGADTVHLGGGNARRVELADFAALGCRVVTNDNEVTLRGAAKLFRR